MPLPMESGRSLAPRAIRELNAALRVICFYPAHHPSVRTSMERILASLSRFLDHGSELDLGFTEKGVLFEGDYLPDLDHQLRSLANLFLDRGVARLRMRDGFDSKGLEDFLRFLASDPSDISRQGGVSEYISSRNLESIRVSEIDTDKILASEATPSREESAGAREEPEVWRKLITDFLQGDEGPAPDGIRRTLRGLAAHADQFSDLVQHLAEEDPQGFPRLLGRLTNEIQREVPDADPPLMDHLGQAIQQLEPQARMDLMMNRIPLADGTPDLLREVTGRMSDPMIVEMVSSFVETESQISPRLVNLCSKILATRGDASSHFGAISAQLRGRSTQRRDFSSIWRSLQGLLVESDPEFLSQTYRDNLEAVSRNVEAVDAESLRVLEEAPGFASAFDGEAIAAHACRTSLAALEMESEATERNSLREEIEQRSRTLTQPRHLGLLTDIVDGLTTSQSSPVDSSSPTPLDPRTLEVGERLLRLFRSGYQQIPPEDRARVAAVFEDGGGGLVPVLIQALSEEKSPEVRKCLLGMVASLGRIAVPLLLKRLEDGSWPLVKNTVFLLGEMGDAKLTDPLAKLLRHPESRVQREAARALGKIGGRQAVTHLREALQNQQARPHALRTLGEIDRARTIAHLVDQLARTGRWVFHDDLAREAISLLRDLRATEGVPRLARILKRRLWLPPRKGDQLRIEAARALWEIGTPEARTAVTTAADCARPSVRKACRSLVREATLDRSSSLSLRGTP